MKAAGDEAVDDEEEVDSYPEEELNRSMRSTSAVAMASSDSATSIPIDRRLL
jgi:hypothetical protein